MTGWTFFRLLLARLGEVALLLAGMLAVALLIWIL